MGVLPIQIYVTEKSDGPRFSQQNPPTDDPLHLTYIIYVISMGTWKLP